MTESSAPSSQAVPPFHLAFPVADLEATRSFYVELLGCSVGRESERWIDLDFHGHQITAHLSPEEVARAATNAVDGKAVPVRHFGAVLPWDAWHELVERLEPELEARGQEWLIEPYLRFRGEPGEQATCFLLDPSGNGLEFKSFKDPSRLFARD